MNKLSRQNRVILIVGSGRWPGPSLATAYAAQGHIVAINDLSPVLLRPICDQHKGQPGQIHSFIADATRGMPLRAMLDEVQETLGDIDILINNPRIKPKSSLFEMDEWDWQRTIEMNLNGPFLVTQLVAHVMRERGNGLIINLVDASQAIPTSGHAAYAASQAGLLAFSQAAAQELIAYNIQVFTICLDGELLRMAESSHQEENNLAILQSAEETLAQLVTDLGQDKSNNPRPQMYRVSPAGYSLVADF